MGILLALVIFIVTYRFLGGSGVHPLWSLGLAIVGTVIVYPVVVGLLAEFVDTLSSSPLQLIGVLGLVGAGGYAYGRFRGTGGNPFKPW